MITSNQSKSVVVDGNEMAAHVAYQLSEVIAIYPITPSSPMGEQADAMASQSAPNLWGTVPRVMEMQSEGGAAGAVHGALQGGSLSTTFTASQGLLLMIPNMYKIAGELTPAVFHVAARSLAAQGLSIFCDHSDVMACRQTGFAMLCAGSVQEAGDFALMAHAATLESRIPFLHFFDGFRTSHEVMKVSSIPTEYVRAMISDELVAAHRERALTPDRPVLRGTAQNPDVYFQARESVNVYYDRLPVILENLLSRWADLSGRQYQLYEYYGDPQATRVIIIMGSGAETVHETVDYLTAYEGQKVGVLKIRLFRPFSAERLINALPKTVEQIAVLDRTKPGSLGEPLYQDVLTAIFEQESDGKQHFSNGRPLIVGGRYGLSSKEFTPGMIKGVYDNLSSESVKNHFTVGIEDDVTHLSLSYDSAFCTEDTDTFRGIFVGLGSDGTVSANKNSIKIIGEKTDLYAQGYFVYDSKKSGSVTKSHLRFGKKPIRSAYLIEQANFIACHQFSFLERFDILGTAQKGATFLVNAPFKDEELWENLPIEVQAQIKEKELVVYAIDAYQVAKEAGLGGRINTIMQTCFFSLTDVLATDRAIDEVKKSIEKSFGKRGQDIVAQNCRAVDGAIAALYRVSIPSEVRGSLRIIDAVPNEAPEFTRLVQGPMLRGEGDSLPVSALPVDGTYPTATSQWEKRNIAQEIPVWEEDICIQCGKCALVCPHAVIRIKAVSDDSLTGAPATLKSVAAKGKEWGDGTRLIIQVSPEDCTGCQLCVEVCPAKDKTMTARKALNMAPQAPLREQESENWKFFLSLPEFDRSKLKVNTIKGSQILQPLFEFSGACSGCGETPYIKLVSQLYGDRMLVANATGCSSIYGGNLPTTPWTKNNAGRGPSWSNSLFEDNAEFGLGMRLSVSKTTEFARELLIKLNGAVPEQLKSSILEADQSDEALIFAQRERVADLKNLLATIASPDAQALLKISDYLVKKSVWIIGGDGWGYDIGFGGLDHVMASGEDINVLLLDTEVYSNTGGQMSKSTPMGAVAKFAASGKGTPKKDLGLILMEYGTVYVARVALGANDLQTLKAVIEAESYPGPSIIIAYSHCIAHGYNLKYGLDQQKLAVDAGHWLLYRYDPRLALKGENPLQLDSRKPKVPLKDYMQRETRFRMLEKIDAKRARQLQDEAQRVADRQWLHYESLAKKPTDNQ